MRTMKRSRQITLVMLAAASAISVAACDNVEDRTAQNEFWKLHGNDGSEQSTIFTDQADCQMTRSADDCLEGMIAAQKEHVRTAPQFANREECEAQFGEGKCGQLDDATAKQNTYYGSGTSNSRPQHANPFIPMMQGYLMGTLMARNSAPIYYGRPKDCAATPGAPGCNGSSGSSARPVYSGPIIVGSSSGSSSGAAISGSRPGSTSIPRPAAVTVSRGGFGGIGSGIGASS
jgi:uncharacterized protein YgiB involved in biofilm formation